MSKFKTWAEFEKELNFTKEDDAEIELERQIIEATIEARKKAQLTQQELSKLTGIVQSSIAKIETFKRAPRCSTLMRLLRPLGYTLKVVPLEKK